MSKETWANILQFTKSIKPNQTTDFPIIANPPSTIDIFTNNLPKTNDQPQQASLLQQQQQPSVFQNLASLGLTSDYNLTSSLLRHPSLHSPLGLDNLIMPRPNPLSYNQADYLSSLLAAQYVANLAPSFNHNMFLPNYSSPMLMNDPIMLMANNQFNELQQSLLQQQQQSSLPNPVTRQNSNQIKRKPVKTEPSTGNLSPQIEQLIQRQRSLKQSAQTQSQMIQTPFQSFPNNKSPSPLTLQQVSRRKVTFDKSLQNQKNQVHQEREIFENKPKNNSMSDNSMYQYKIKKRASTHLYNKNDYKTYYTQHYPSYT